MRKMQGAPHDRGKNLAESILGWWHDAGVDYLCADTTINWLEEPSASPAPVDEQAHRLAPSTATTPSIAKRSIRTDWPDQQDALVAAIIADPSLPGNAYSPARAAPHSVRNPELMVFLDFPEEEDLRAGTLGQGPVGQLLQAMLKACGYGPDNVYIGALAYSRPATGALPEPDVKLLNDFARHQIKVVKPRKLLLLGAAVADTLLGEDLMTARANLRDFNQDGANLTSVTSFHPRTLLVRPVLKAQAWRDLQRIVRKDQA